MRLTQQDSCLNEKTSLRNKLLRGVGEQRMTGERDFRCFARAKNGARTKKRNKHLVIYKVTITKYVLYRSVYIFPA